MPRGGTGRPAKVRIGATNNKPELVETIPITPADKPRKWEVVMRLGPNTESDDPMPDLRPGDKLRVCAELEVTTDAPDEQNPGLIGEPYKYSPKVEARFLFGDRPDAIEPGGDVQLLDRWEKDVSHKRHHEVVVLDRGELTIPGGWSGSGFVTVALSASSPHARPDGQDRLLVGENEDKPVVDQDVSGIRLLRFRPGDQREIDHDLDTNPRRRHVRVAKEKTPVFSKALDGLQKNEQLFVHGRLVADAGDVGYDARLSARVFLASDPDDVEPKGHAQEIASWKGHLSKENGANCVRGEGPQRLEKFGVLRLKHNARDTVFVNLVATSSAPHRADGNKTPGDPLPIGDGSFLAVTRYGPDHFG